MRVTPSGNDSNICSHREKVSSVDYSPIKARLFCLSIYHAVNE